jgi:hypothetical protein
MAHSAAIYLVSVHRSRQGDPLPLGDIDGSGAHLVEAIRGYLQEIDGSEEGTTLRFVRAMSQRRDEAAAVLEVGESGVGSELQLGRQRRRQRRRPDDSEFLKLGVVFRLPRDAEIGSLAIHVPHQRGTKGTLHKELRQRFREDFPDAILEIMPFIPKDALEAAIEQDMIDQVKLVAYQQPGDRFEDAQKWIAKEDLGSIELVLHPKKLRRFKSNLLRGLHADRTATMAELVVFEGLTFDQAKVRFEVGDSRKRTVNVEKPATGHAFTYDLEDGYGLKIDGDGVPTDASLSKALRQVLTEVIPTRQDAT